MRISASSSREGLADRVEATFQSVLENYKGRDWPSVAVFAEAAKNTAPSDKSLYVVGTAADPLTINGARIKRMETVGDEWIFGRCAADLLVAGEVVENDLTPYRSAIFFSEKELIGQDEALRREAVRRNKHDEARIAAGLPPFFNRELEREST